MATTNPTSVLVVDDDPDVRDTLCEVLSGEGYRATGVANGAEALAALCTGACLPSVILLDLMMPVMDGYEFRRRQRAEAAFADIPVVVITAHGRPGDLPDDRFLAKPVELSELLGVIAGCCHAERTSVHRA